MVEVAVYLDAAITATTTDFDVPPRIGERIFWQTDPMTAPTVHRVITVMHQPRVAGFRYVIGITADT